MALISLTHICIPNATPPELVAIAAEAGFGAVGLRLEPAMPEDARLPMSVSSAMMKETKRRLQDTDLRVLDADVFRLVSGMGFERYRPVLEACAELGALELLTTCNINQASEAADLLHNACDVASEYGLNVNIEFMPWQAVNDLKAASTLVERVNRENGVLLVDTLHVHRSKVFVEELAAIDRSRMRYLQLSDATAPPPDFETMLFQARYERLLPGDGVIPLQEYLDVLPKTLPVAAEVPMQARLAQIGSSDFAREVYARTRESLDRAGW